MKPMQIDFATPGWRRTLYRLHPALLGAGVAGTLLCIGAAALALQTVQERDARERQQSAARQKAAAAARAPVRLPETAIPEAQATAVNAAVMQLNLPWRALQDAVASATPSSIALVALEPDARKQTLKITAEARNADEMVAYVEQLKQQEFFLGAGIVRHEINASDPNRPIRFQVEAQWRAR
jgi:Tfp pilus assembly protein PilN